MTTYTARWIFPVDAPPIEGGAITVRSGNIVAVESRGVRTADVDLGNVAILPGFVNAHTHLDLSGARAKCKPEAANTDDEGFTNWLRQVIAFRRTRTPEEVEQDITAGVVECLRFGATTIGDIGAEGASRSALTTAPCHSVLFYELLGLSEDRAQRALQNGRDWLGNHPFRNRCIPGFSPHAPYSVRKNVYREVGQRWLPVATHLAETRAELQLLRKRSGSFADLLKELGAWDDSGMVADVTEVLDALPRGCFVHCNYLDPATPFLATQSVIVCPRTHAAFGHSHHPFVNMNVRVALGTDSLASNPDLDILAEARFLRDHYPEVAPVQIVRMLTLNGAEALGIGVSIGSLTPSKSADLVILPLENLDKSDPHDLVLQSTLPVQRVMFRGEWR